MLVAGAYQVIEFAVMRGKESFGRPCQLLGSGPIVKGALGRDCNQFTSRTASLPRTMERAVVWVVSA